MNHLAINWFKTAMSKPEWILDAENAESLDEVQKILLKNGIQSSLVPFPDADAVLVAKDGDDIYVIEDGFVKHANEWIYSIGEWNLYKYVGDDRFSEKFWEHPETLYHGTYSSNVPEIMSNGIIQRNKSRGISNRGTPSAVFTSMNPDAVESYGDSVLEIDTATMKFDGYMPEVAREAPVAEAEARNALTMKLGMENFVVEVEAGIDFQTVIIYGPVPPKYLRQM